MTGRRFVRSLNLITLIFDLETYGDAATEAALEMALKRNEDPRAFTSLCPPLARVVCAGIMNFDPAVSDVTAQRAVTIMDAKLFPYWPDDIPDVLEAHPGERAVLTRVNEILGKADRLVTFNGRGFDLPVLIHRMIANNLAPHSRLLAAARESRYYPKIHFDLAEEFSFHGAAPRQSLRAYAVGYGLEDPKAKGDGAGIGELIASGDPQKLADYCLGDVRSTGALYDRWSSTLGLGSAAS